MGEPLLRSFVQFSPYLFFNVISKKCPSSPSPVTGGLPVPRIPDGVHLLLPCSALPCAFHPADCPPPLSSHFSCPLAYLLRSQYFVTLCQHEKVHSTVAHTVCWGEPGTGYTWGFCHLGIIVSLLFIKSLSFVILIFGYVFFQNFSTYSIIT